MSSKERRSRRAGIGVCGSRFVQLYEALQAHSCILCDRDIDAGELFTRGGVHGQPSTSPVCRDCRGVVLRQRVGLSG
ncbi:MAG TPA: hypothetical protein VFI42_16480 [Thermomicrobiaceae bacterium]|nr:hypothetical protein [Thermomicrobiaceae bacterium]